MLLSWFLKNKENQSPNQTSCSSSTWPSLACLPPQEPCICCRVRKNYRTAAAVSSAEEPVEVDELLDPQPTQVSLCLRATGWGEASEAIVFWFRDWLLHCWRWCDTFRELNLEDVDSMCKYSWKMMSYLKYHSVLFWVNFFVLFLSNAVE